MDTHGNLSRLYGNHGSVNSQADFAICFLLWNNPFRGQEGFADSQDEAQKALIRVSSDGKTDPLLAVLPELLDGESQGVLMDSNTLKATLRKLAVYWRKSKQKLPCK